MIETLILIAVGLTFLGIAFGYVELNQKPNKILIKKWHIYKWFSLVFLMLPIGFNIYGYDLKTLYFLWMIGHLTVVIFNTTINIVKGNELTYISQTEGIEHYFRKVPLLYLLGNLAIPINIYIFLL